MKSPPPVLTGARIGRGSYGKVMKTSSQGVCVKVFDCKLERKREADMSALLREKPGDRVVSTLARSAVGVPPSLSLCMELASGSLHDAWKDTMLGSGGVSHARFAAWACRELCCVADALELLARDGFLYWDLKPENLLVFRKDRTPARLKLGDLGSWTRCDDQDLTPNTYVTPVYLKVAAANLEALGSDMALDFWENGGRSSPSRLSKSGIFSLYGLLIGELLVRMGTWISRSTLPFDRCFVAPRASESITPRSSGVREEDCHFPDARAVETWVVPPGRDDFGRFERCMGAAKWSLHAKHGDQPCT